MKRASVGGRANWAGAAFELRLGVEFCIYILLGDAAGLKPGAACRVQLQAPEPVDDLVLEFETGARWAVQAKAGPSVRVEWNPDRPFGKALRQLHNGATSGQIDLALDSPDRIELAVDHRAPRTITDFHEWLTKARYHLSWERFAAACTGQEQEWVQELPAFLGVEPSDDLLAFLKRVYVRRAPPPEEWRSNLRGRLITAGVPNAATADRILDMLLAKVAEMAPYAGQLDTAALHRVCEGIPGIPRRRTAPFVLPQLDVSTFTGRDEELARLEELLLERKMTNVCSIVGLAGAGGIGKSALACHFAELHKADFPDGVIGLRVDGKDVDTVAREFTRCCGEEIDPDDERDATTIMQDVFRHRRALLIFDNADKATIRSLLPGGDRCAVIVTTRDRGLPVLLDVPAEGRIDLPPLPDPDSLRLLERLLGEERVTAEIEAACEIIGLVGNLPLALQIVGAALQIREWRSLADYATSLRGERARLAKLRIRGGPHLDVRASFSLSLRLLEDEEIDFFACLNVCAEDGFSVRAGMAAGDCDKSTAQERLTYLYRLSLLNRPQFGAVRFVFHPLIRLFAQELAIERSLQDEAAERHARFFVNLVKSCDIQDHTAASVLAEELDDIILAAEWLQSQGRADYDFVIRLEPFFQQYGHWQQAVNLMSGFLSLAERIEDWNGIVQLRIQQAKYLSLRGEWSQALEVLAPVVDIVGRIEAQAARQRCEAMWLNTLGGVLQRLGRFDEAVDAFQRSYAISEELGDQRSLAMVLNSLGGVLQRLGRFDEAVDAFQRSYAISEELGDQRSLAMVLNSLGGVLQRLGRFDEAVDAFQRSYAISEELGDQRSLAMVLNSLGGVLQRLGRFDEAVDAFQRSYAISEELGDQRSLAMVLNSLGGVLQRLGRFDEAVDAFQRSIQIGEELGDKRHLAMVLNSLGGVLQRLGRFDEAVDAFQRSIQIGEELGDKRHLAMVLNSLGGVLQRLGRFDEAVDAFQPSIQIGKELDDQRGQAMVLNSLGGVLQRLGRFDEAVDAFQRSYTISEELDDQRGQAMVLNSLGGVLQRLGRFDEAVDAFQPSYDLLVEQGDQRGQAMVLNSLGGVLQRLGRFDEAVDAFQPSYDLLVEQGDQRGQAMVLNSLGGVLQRLGRFDEAVDAFQPSYDLLVEQGDQRGQAMVLNSLGGVLQRIGRFDEAVDAFQRSYTISDELGDQRGQAMVLNSLGGVLQRIGRFDEAVDAFQRSYTISDELGDQRGQAMVLNSLGGVLQRIGRFDEAVDDFQRSAAIEEQIGNQRGLAMVLNSLGGVLQRLGRFDEAVDAFQRSAAIEEQIGNQRGLAIVLNSLGGVMQRLGRFDEAVDDFQRSYDLLVEQGDQRGQAMVLTAMGKTLLLHGDVEVAAVELRQGFEIDEGLKNRRGMGIVTPALIQALARLGRHGEALTYCQRALAIAPKNGQLLQLREWLSSPEIETARLVLKQGTVKCVIKHARGYHYGFIAPDDNSADIYFREGYIDPDCLSRLAEGVRVEVEVEQAPKGPRAKNVKVIA